MSAEAPSKPAKRRTGLKWQRILRLLVEGRRLTRLEAEAEGDHALPSTVSAIQRQGVRVQRQLVERPGRFGTTTILAEYWLAPDEIERARRVLGDA